MDYILGASIVNTFVRMIIDLWEISDKDVYAKEKNAAQEKWKAKAAISV